MALLTDDGHLLLNIWSQMSIQYLNGPCNGCQQKALLTARAFPRPEMLLTRFAADSQERAVLDHGLGLVGCGQMLLEFQVRVGVLELVATL